MSIASNAINVFPNVKRDAQNPGEYSDARIFYEKNVTGLINHLLDVDGFVITKSLENIQDDDHFEFNIKGYYISIAWGVLKEAVVSYSGDIYASLSLDNNQELNGIDDEGSYTGGITFSTSSDNPPYSLKILNKSGNTYTIPEGSHVRFEANSFVLDKVDGGEI